MPGLLQALGWLVALSLGLSLGLLALVLTAIAAAIAWPLATLYSAPDALRGLTVVRANWLAFIGADKTVANKDEPPANDN